MIAQSPVKHGERLRAWLVRRYALRSKNKTQDGATRQSEGDAARPACSCVLLRAPAATETRRVSATPRQRGREAAKECEGAQKLEDMRNRAAVKEQNGAVGDKVRKSGASYENIYHSTNVWLQRGLELICVFLGWGGLLNVCVCGVGGGAASCDRMGNTQQPRTFSALRCLFTIY